MGADSVFHVAALGFPPCEERADLPQSASALNFFGGPPVEPDALLRAELAQCDHPEERVVLLQNVWLDRQDTMDALGKVGGACVLGWAGGVACAVWSIVYNRGSARSNCAAAHSLAYAAMPHQSPPRGPPAAQPPHALPTSADLQRLPGRRPHPPSVCAHGQLPLWRRWWRGGLP
jgi:hypothetical protein